jgi:hypothetical protein
MNSLMFADPVKIVGDLVAPSAGGPSKPTRFGGQLFGESASRTSVGEQYARTAVRFIVAAFSPAAWDRRDRTRARAAAQAAA